VARAGDGASDTASARDATEEPTARRLAAARRAGDVVFSRELSSSLGLAAVVLVLVSGAPAAWEAWVAWLRVALRAAVAGGAPGAEVVDGVMDRVVDGGTAGLRLLGPPLVALVLVGLGVGLAQTGGLVLAPVRVDLRRLGAGGGWRRALGIFDRATAAAFAQSSLQLALLAAVAWLTLRPSLGALVGLAGAPPRRVLGALGVLGERLAVRLALAAVAFGVVDYLLVARRHHQRLRMTREEVRRERKESEGDPALRGARQRLHRELAEQRTVDDVRRADLVVVGGAPETDVHAIALRYDPRADAAPVVVASGARLVAARLQQLAREAGVPIVADGPLAGALAALGPGAEIPADLYEVVAALLRDARRDLGRDSGARAIARGDGGKPV
jgi:flagellar biosynthesis protein FlhB